MSEKLFELDYDDEDSVCFSNFLENGEKLTDREVVDLLNSLVEENEQLKEAKYEYKQDWKQASANCDLYKQEISFLKDELKGFEEENEQLRQMIKENVFQRYREGSLADLKFKAIAYDDIINVKLSDELEPKVIVYCKQGKKENVMSFCQMFIPFGIAYEIKEGIDDE